MDVTAQSCENLKREPVMFAVLARITRGSSSGIECRTLYVESYSPLGGFVQKAVGKFDVKLNALPQYNNSVDAKLARMSLDKQFYGDLVGTSQGEMLSAGTEIKGSAGYVAIERFTGRLNDRRGSFVLQHNATMTRGAPYLNITVVPDSGTEELAGLTGNMNIIIDKGNHSYEFVYSFSDRQ